MTDVHGNKGERNYPCGECDKRFFRLYELEKHQKVHKPIAVEKTIERKQCLTCGIRVKDLERHQQIHSENKPFSCSICDKSFAELAKLKQHTLTHNAIPFGNSFSCEICKKSFRLASQLKIHDRMHTGEKPYMCLECNKRFRDSGDMNKHRAAVHSNEKIYPCNLCDKKFVTMSYLKSHVSSHNQSKAFKCEKCDKDFKTLCELRKHSIIHDGNRISYHCSYSGCAKSVFSSQSLQNHERTHSEKRFVRQECNRAFATQDRLTKHAKTHERSRERTSLNVEFDPLRPHKCTLCNKTFRHAIYLKKHGNCGQRYPCDQCEVTFLSKSYIKIHKRLHTGEMPYSCPKCLKTFTQNSQFHRHLKTHKED